MVVDIRGDKVRLGVTAPEEVRVLRGELVVPKDPAQSIIPNALKGAYDPDGPMRTTAAIKAKKIRDLQVRLNKMKLDFKRRYGAHWTDFG